MDSEVSEPMVNERQHNWNHSCFFLQIARALARAFDSNCSFQINVDTENSMDIQIPSSNIIYSHTSRGAIGLQIGPYFWVFGGYSSYDSFMDISLDHLGKCNKYCNSITALYILYFGSFFTFLLFTRDACEQASLNQLKQYILFCWAILVTL